MQAFVRICVGFILALMGTTAVAGVNPDYDPQWQTNDQWNVQFNYVVAGPQKYVHYSVYPTNLAYPCLALYDWTQETADYRYRVDFVGITNGTPRTIISMSVVTNSRLLGTNWELEFETNSVTLQRLTMVRKPSDRTLDEMGGTHYGNDTWLTECYGNPAAIVDFPKIPTNSVSGDRWINDTDRPNRPVHQENIFTSSNVTVVLTRTNYVDHLDQRVTFVWPKNAKWWKAAKLEYGTNLVISAERIE